MDRLEKIKERLDKPNYDDPNYGYSSLFDFNSVADFREFINKATKDKITKKLQAAAELIREHPDGKDLDEQTLKREAFRLVHDACVWNARMLTVSNDTTVHDARNAFLTTLSQIAKNKTNNIASIPTDLFGTQPRKDRVLGVT